MAALPGTPAVGPGIVVTGAVSATRGRVVSAAEPVVNCHVNGAVIARPLSSAVAPVIVAVYSVNGASVLAGASVRRAIDCVLSRVAAPSGLTQGAVQVNLKVAAPLNDASGTLNAALMTNSLIATPVAPSTGASPVTVGASAVLGAAPVVNCDMNGVAKAMPVARLVTPLTVTV